MASRPFSLPQITDYKIGHHRSQLRSSIKTCRTNSRYDGSWPGIADMPQTAIVPALAAGFIEIDLDLETGKFEILDYLGVADCGVVMHPQGLAAQIRSGAIMGFGLATTERHVYDPEYGRPNARGLYQAKPKTYLDVPPDLQWAAVDLPDEQAPLGSKGIGEPVEGAASSALLCALSDALGGHMFNRTPVVTDMIINAAAGQPQSHKPLQTNCQ